DGHDESEDVAVDAAFHGRAGDGGPAPVIGGGPGEAINHFAFEEHLEAHAGGTAGGVFVEARGVAGVGEDVNPLGDAGAGGLERDDEVALIHAGVGIDEGRLAVDDAGGRGLAKG